jgi:phospholipid/cholesterol/gamma-HCH transport system ATP-binding protein
MSAARLVRSPRRDDAGPFLEIEGVTRAFGSNQVLRGIDLAITRGEILTLLGGSGTGKSVLLKHMIGLLRPDAGRVIVDGIDTTGLSERAWVDLRRRFGYVFQGAALFDSLSVFENVAYPLREHLSLGEEELHARVADCLSSVGLAGIEAMMPSELSGGMRKRVAVARAIALEPDVILYDEPTTGLDPANARRIGQLIVSLRDRLGVTSVVVTHELDLCFEISDRVALLKDGTIVACGPADEIKASRAPEVRAFLAGGGSLEADSVWLTEDDGAGAAKIESSERQAVEPESPSAGREADAESRERGADDGA